MRTCTVIYCPTSLQGRIAFPYLRSNQFLIALWMNSCRSNYMLWTCQNKIVDKVYLVNKMMAIWACKHVDTEHLACSTAMPELEADSYVAPMRVKTLILIAKPVSYNQQRRTQTHAGATPTVKNGISGWPIRARLVLKRQTDQVIKLKMVAFSARLFQMLSNSECVWNQFPGVFCVS